MLKKLSRFDVLMIDDFGYVKQDREEMEVLFTLLAYRYERGSMLITNWSKKLPIQVTHKLAGHSNIQDNS